MNCWFTSHGVACLTDVRREGPDLLMFLLEGGRNTPAAQTSRAGSAWNPSS